jgi:hypothetical protein
MNSNIRQRSELHADGKLGQLIQLMSGKPKEELDLQTRTIHSLQHPGIDKGIWDSDCQTRV